MAKRYLVVWYDVSDLNQHEIDQLTLEAVVQGEENDGDPQDLDYHPSVPVATDLVESPIATELVASYLPKGRLS